MVLRSQYRYPYAYNVFDSLSLFLLTQRRVVSKHVLKLSWDGELKENA